MPTEKLLKLGIHNTLVELVEAHQSTQELRLTPTIAGREILKAIGKNAEPFEDVQKLPSNVRNTIIIKPLAMNIHPSYYKDRRIARAKVLAKKYEGMQDVVYVDVAAYPAISKPS